MLLISDENVATTHPHAYNVADCDQLPQKCSIMLAVYNDGGLIFGNILKENERIIYDLKGYVGSRLHLVCV